jgi:hypothetical protein
VTPDSPKPEMPASVSMRIMVWLLEGRILMSVMRTLPRSAAVSLSKGAKSPAIGRASAEPKKSRLSIALPFYRRLSLDGRAGKEARDLETLVSWFSPNFEARNGVIKVPTGPVPGIEIDPDYLKKAQLIKA